MNNQLLLEECLTYLTNVNGIDAKELAKKIADRLDIEWVWDDAAAPAWADLLCAEYSKLKALDVWTPIATPPTADGFYLVINDQHHRRETPIVQMFLTATGRFNAGKVSEPSHWMPIPESPA